MGKSRTAWATGAGAAVLALGLLAPSASAAKGNGILLVDVQKAASPGDHQLWRGGEPQLAINPRNPDNIVEVWASMKNDNLSCIAAEETQQWQCSNNDVLNQPAPIALQQLIQAGGTSHVVCQMAVSHDAGKTWSSVVWPSGPQPGCSDPMIVADSRGVFHLAFDSMGDPYTSDITPNLGVDHVRVSKSTDGNHWSFPVITADTIDRPNFTIDRATDYLYLASGFSRHFTMSKNHGATWTDQVAWGPSHLAVNHGVIGRAAQDSAGMLQLEYSKDNGQTFATDPVKGATAGGTGDYIVADNTHAGRFALLQLVNADGGSSGPAVPFASTASDPTIVEVLRTSDFGRTWSKPQRLTVKGRGVLKPWIDYGPSGDLGVIWRSTDAAGNYLIYSALMPEGSAAFGPIVQVTKQASAPQAKNATYASAGDDVSFIHVGGNLGHGKVARYAYLGWGSWVSGNLETWFARVPFSAY